MSRQYLACLLLNKRTFRSVARSADRGFTTVARRTTSRTRKLVLRCVYKLLVLVSLSSLAVVLSCLPGYACKYRPLPLPRGIVWCQRRTAVLVFVQSLVPLGCLSVRVPFEARIHRNWMCVEFSARIFLFFLLSIAFSRTWCQSFARISATSFAGHSREKRRRISRLRLTTKGPARRWIPANLTRAMSARRYERLLALFTLYSGVSSFSCVLGCRGALLLCFPGPRESGRSSNQRSR